MPSASRITIIAKTKEIANRGESKPSDRAMELQSAVTMALCPDGIPE